MQKEAALEFENLHNLPTSQDADCFQFLDIGAKFFIKILDSVVVNAGKPARPSP